MTKPVRLLLVVLIVLHAVAVLYIALRNPRHVPVGDPWRRLPVALMAYDGTLRVRDIFTPEDGHFTVFTYAMTASGVYATDWNLKYEVYVNLILAIVNFGLLLYLAYRTIGNLPVIVILIVSVGALSIRQHLNWILGYFGAWQFSLAFMLLSVVFMERFGTRWWGLLITALFALCASFSVTGGFVTWGIVLLYLLLNRSASAWKVRAWIAISLGAVILYVLLGGLMSTATTVVFVQQIGAWLSAVPFMLMVIGLVFDGTQTITGGLTIGITSVILLSVNLWEIHRRGQHHKFVHIWLPLAVGAMGIAYMAGLKRAVEFGIEIAMSSSWYTTPMIPFWLAVLLSGVVVVYASAQNIRESPLAIANIVFITLVMLSYPFSAVASLQHPRSVYYRVDSQDPECLMRFIIQQTDPDACSMTDTQVNIVNQLAARQLTTFSDVEAVTLPGIAFNDTVVLQTSSQWSALHIKIYYMAMVPESVVHVVHTGYAENLPQWGEMNRTTSIEAAIGNDDISRVVLVTDGPFNPEDISALPTGFTVVDTQIYDYGITVSQLERQVN